MHNGCRRCEKEVVTVRPDATVFDIADTMDEHSVGCVVVTDADQRPLGVVTDRDLVRRVLAPGLFVRVRVPVGRPHRALLVTERALDSDQGQKILHVVNDRNEVVSRPVRLGALHDGLRVIEDGLKPDERVIVNGLQHVRPGVVVEPKLVDMPAAPAAGDLANKAKPRKPAGSAAKSEQP